MKGKIIPYTTFVLCTVLIGRVIWFGAFGDEQENITAGWLMSQGLTPYTDFFFHHTPIPFYISRLLFLFTQHEFWIFRACMLGFHLLTWTYLASILPQRKKWAAVLAVGLVALGLPLFLLQMFLADTIASLALVTLATSWAVYVSGEKTHPLRLLYVTTLCSLVAVWSSITTILSVAVILISAFCILGSHGLRVYISAVTWPKICGAFCAFIGIPLFYLVSGHWAAFFWAVFDYNNRYYFKYRLTAGEIEKQKGFIFAVWSDYLHYITHTGGNIISGLYTFLLTIKGSILIFFTHTSFKVLGQHLAIATESIKNILATPESLALISLFLLIGAAAVYFRKWMLPLVLLSITLRSRTNELFHLSPFYVCVWMAVSMLLVWSYTRHKKILQFFTTLLYISWILVLFPSYRTHLQEKKPMILPQMVSQSDVIKKQAQTGDTLLLIGGNTMYYTLTGLMPATPQMYYHPWFAIVPSMHDEVMQTVTSSKAHIIVIEEYKESLQPGYFSYDIAEQVRSHYSSVGNGVFVIPR